MRVICYIPMLEGQAGEVERWLGGVRDRYGVIPVMLPPVDWNDDLTPWPSEPIFRKGKAFGGNADAYLATLENEIIPDIESEMDVIPDERWLVGVSLAGLFAVWATARTRFFTRVASVSGSFWYPGFTEWLQGRDILAKSAYISLGDREAGSKNRHLQGIDRDTEAVVGLLASKGVETVFEWTEGTHFGPILPRLESALSSLAKMGGNM